MRGKIRTDAVYAVSDRAVARKIQDEIILIPLEDDRSEERQIITLNKAAQVIWKKINGRRKVKDIIAELADRFDAPLNVIEKDVVSLIGELLKRNFIIESSKI